jgi:hypothetical protein
VNGRQRQGIAEKDSKGSQGLQRAVELLLLLMMMFINKGSMDPDYMGALWLGHPLNDFKGC